MIDYPCRFQFPRMQYKTITNEIDITLLFSLFLGKQPRNKEKILIRKFWLFTEYEWIWIQSLCQGIVRD